MYERDERFGSSLSVRLAAAAVIAAIAVVTAVVATAVKAAATAAQQDQNEDNDPGASTVVTHIVFPLSDLHYRLWEWGELCDGKEGQKQVDFH